MLTLAIDTTSPGGSAAILDGTKLLAEASVETHLDHSARLLASVHFLLESCGLDIRQVDGFSLAAGPGSFTGIRVGLSTVKAFAFASGKPVAAVSTLAALALKLVQPQVRLLCPVIDAKKGEVYAALFEWSGARDRMKEVVPQGAYKPDEFLAQLPGHRLMAFIGTGAALYKEKILTYVKDQARFSPRSLFIAHEVGLLGYELLSRGKGSASGDLRPIYFRKSQAEDKDSKA
ncbi:MAG: tRNA (adenosine(37)-N6)-threonylcarbamoyltransferase complex dimerization subunit type 1 TsaB [Candidatus Aminicenantes bacterium RBG_13_63_10]|nr:MAG: tRNA (adenosine(37)-N6)-threonylcarbamoyltransferase complex dimerization subunit type 1 TsaB [Candidatus Aminicenantes bacterium RBG_13_63_10]